MPIERTVAADGSWTEKATDPKSAVELFEKHKDGLQKHGAEQFHKSYMRDLSIGGERLIGPQGVPENVRADEVDSALASGFSPMNRPRTVVPELPWPKKSDGPGRHRFKYNRETGNMEEC